MMPSPETCPSGFQAASQHFMSLWSFSVTQQSYYQAPNARNPPSKDCCETRWHHGKICLVSCAPVMAPLRRTWRYIQRLVRPPTHGAVVSWSQRTWGQGQHEGVIPYGRIQRLRANIVQTESRSCSQGDTRLLSSLQHQHLAFSTAESQGHSSSFTSSKNTFDFTHRWTDDGRSFWRLLCPIGQLNWCKS